MGYRKEAAKGISEGALWIIGIGVVALLVGGFFWGIGVFTSNTRGAGDAVKINNSAENRIEKQEKFEKLYAKVKTNEDLVAQHTASVAASPDSQQAKTILEGVKSACNASVNEYNAEARKVTSQDWKAYDLPESLTNTRCQ